MHPEVGGRVLVADVLGDFMARPLEGAVVVVRLLGITGGDQFLVGAIHGGSQYGKELFQLQLVDPQRQAIGCGGLHQLGLLVHCTAP